MALVSMRQLADHAARGTNEGAGPLVAPPRQTVIEQED